MDLENLSLIVGKEDVDFLSLLEEFKHSSIEANTYEISFPSETDESVLIHYSDMDLSQHSFSIIDTCVVSSKKLSVMKYPDMVVEGSQFDRLTDMGWIHEIDIPAEAHSGICSNLAFNDGGKHIVQGKWGESFSDSSIALTRSCSFEAGMLVLFVVPFGPHLPFTIEVIAGSEIIFREEILLNESVISFLFSFGLGMPFACKYNLDTKTSADFLELCKAGSKVVLELSSTVGDNPFRKTINLNCFFKDLQYILRASVCEPSTTSCISAVVVNERMKIDKANTLDDNPIHDIGLPAIVRFRVFKIFVRLELPRFSMLFSVFAENTPDRLSMEFNAPFPSEVSYLTAASASAFLFNLQDGILHIRGHQLGISTGFVTQTLDAEFFVTFDIVLDGRSRTAGLFTSLIYSEVAGDDRQYETEPFQYSWVFEHWFHLDHQRGQGGRRMSFLPLGRLGVTKLRRFGCYTTHNAYTNPSDALPFPVPSFVMPGYRIGFSLGPG